MRLESNKCLKIGIFGGTFNPPHLGHKNAIATAMRALGLDKMLVVPAANPPHKELPIGSPLQAQRLDMVRLMAQSIPNCEVLDIELHREGKSYSVDTVREIAKQYPSAQLWLVMGTDMFLSFAAWREPREIAAHCRLAVMMREPLQKEKLLAHAMILQNDVGAKTDLIDIDVLEISSTQARKNIAVERFEGLLQKDISDYIVANSLYSLNLSCDLADNIVEYAKANLSEKRFKHTLGCAKYAVHLARIFGEDENKAATAAILHDVTKELTYENQLNLCAKYGIMIEYSLSEAPKLLHADTAAALAREEFHVCAEIEQAIARHTTAAANMSKLDKIMYLADMLEENRDFEGVFDLRKLSEQSLEEALIISLQQSIDYIKSKNVEPNKRSQKAIEFLLTEKAKKQ